ncbi:MAG: LPXTG cell wall anchor domain-containing protein [Firmicutes bacterium]|nr:LPXTG cell wall anchor domain-containing protein [Bacillota bacterium]
MKRILIFSLLFVMVFAAWPMTAGAEGPPAEVTVTPGPASAIQQAITEVADGGVIHLAAGLYPITETIVVDKPVTIKGAENFGTELVTAGSHTVFKLAAAAVLDGLYIHKTDKTSQTLVSITANGTTIKNCKFTGEYAQGDSEVVRAILPNAGINFNIVGNIFDSVRQPAYLEGPGIVKGNFVRNTRGWVVCVDHNALFSDNSFADNAVDIAIIANNQTESEYYTDVAAISAANNGAYVENQLLNISAKGGELFQTIAVIHDDGTTEYYQTLPAAVNAAPAGATVWVYPGEYNLSSQLSITKSLTLRGPNWNNNPTGGGARGPEAVITAPARAFWVRSNDVIIEGFTFSTKSTAIWVDGADEIQSLVMSCNIFDGDGDNSVAFSTSAADPGSPNRIIRALSFCHNVVTDVRSGIFLGLVDGAVIRQNTFILNNQDSWAIRLLDRVGEIQIAENRFLHGGVAVEAWETTEVFDWVEIVANVINDQSIAGIRIRRETDATKFTVAGNTFSETPVLISNKGTGKVNAPDNLVSCSADETTVQINFAELEDDSSVQLVRENELEIELLAAALPGNVEVSVKKVDGDAPEGFKFIGSVYSFTMTAEDGSAVSEFLGKVTMVFHYDPADVDDPDNLDVYWYNPDTGKWVAQNGTVDTERCTVTIEVDHWSEYALMEAESEEEGGLPKTGTNIDWLIPLGLLLLVAGAFVWRRHLAAGTGELA